MRAQSDAPACEAAMPSTVIRSFQYDEASYSLLITFQSGRRYRYLDVPAKTVDELRAASSKGRFFNTSIRGQFAYREESAGREPPMAGPGPRSTKNA
jgi:hypothetical protein